MEYFHTIDDVAIDLSKAISRHSADATIIYKYVDQQPLYLGLYYPELISDTQKYPLFLFVHGGSWESKKIFDDQPHWKGDYLGFLARYYADKGYICASIDYRLVQDKGQKDQYGIIDAYEDCCDAIDHLLSQADKFRIDRQKVFLLGESAGGHLAGAIATFRYDRSYCFQTVFLVNPITDLSDPAWIQYLPKESSHKELSGLTTQEKAMFLSPLNQANKDTGYVVLLHGGSDTCVNPDHSRLFYSRMNQLSGKCDLHILEGTNHAFLLAEYTKEISACYMAVSIIDEQLCN